MSRGSLFLHKLSLKVVTSGLPSIPPLTCSKITPQAERGPLSWHLAAALRIPSKSSFGTLLRGLGIDGTDMGQTAEHEGGEARRRKAAHIVAVVFAVVIVIQLPLTLTKFLGSDIRPAATLLGVSPSLSLCGAELRGFWQDGARIWDGDRGRPETDARNARANNRCQECWRMQICRCSHPVLWHLGWLVT